MARADMPTYAWDSGQRHTGRAWLHLAVLGVLVAMNLVTIASMPFIDAHAEDPLAAWIALVLLAAVTLKLAATGVFGNAGRLERVASGATGVELRGAALAHIGAAYRPIEVQVRWRDVRAIDLQEAGPNAERGVVVEMSLDADNPFGREIRLVFANRARAEAFVARAHALSAASGAA
jgi:hypothetical protein